VTVAQEPLRRETPTEITHAAAGLLSRGSAQSACITIQGLLAIQTLSVEQELEARFILGLALRETGLWEEAQTQFGLLLRKGDTNPTRVITAQLALLELNEILGPRVPFGMSRIPAGEPELSRWRELRGHIDQIAPTDALAPYLQRWARRMENECALREDIEARRGELAQLAFADALNRIGDPSSPGALVLVARIQAQRLGEEAATYLSQPEMFRTLTERQVDVFVQLDRLLDRIGSGAAATEMTRRERATLCEYASGQITDPATKTWLLHLTRESLSDLVRRSASAGSTGREEHHIEAWTELARFGTRTGDHAAAATAARTALGLTERHFGVDSLEYAISAGDVVTALMQANDPLLEPEIYRYRESLSNILETAAREARELFLQGRTPEASAIRHQLTPLTPFILPGHPANAAIARCFSRG